MLRRFSVLVALLIAFTATQFVEKANAKKCRSCDAHLIIQLYDTQGEYQTRAYVAPFKMRRCVSGYNPNKARRAARDRAIACVQKFFQNPGSAPPECTDMSTGSGDSGLQKKLPAPWYTLGPKTAALIEAKSLSETYNGVLKNKNSNYRYRVLVQTHGNTGCRKDPLVVVSPLRRVDSRLPKSVKFKVENERLARWSSKAKPMKIISKQSVQYSVAGRSYNSQKTSIVPASVKSLATGGVLRNEEHSYNGCGRHAGHHVMMWSGKRLSFRGETSPAFDIVRGPLIPKREGLKPMTPGMLKQGLNNLLRRHGTGLSARVYRRVTRPQEAIFNHVSSKGPVIALVQGGSHYVTALGTWHPLLQPRSERNFYTFNNGTKEYFATSSYYNLRFSSFYERLMFGDWRPGTMILTE